MKYETVIGLEVHVQLQTASKMFCPCRADYQSAEANTHVCPVCLGLPGTLPVINRKAVEYTIMTGLALNCRIPGFCKFDRKNYPYPDLMKGYQISQYDLPLAVEGFLELESSELEPGAECRRIGITRVHLEEDVAKLQHHLSNAQEQFSLVDVNRSGVPLMEVVSEPDMRSPEEAREYLTTLHSILQYLGVSTANMQDGSFRCDANISIRPEGSDEFGTRSEVKNMNSFRSVYQALRFEVDRQIQVVESGGRVVQETRGWVEERNVTVSQRSKEQAHDYRYFPEPDLPPLSIDGALIEEIRGRLPELATQRRQRFVRQYAVPEYDANLLTSSKDMADFFEQTIATDQANKQLPGGVSDTTVEAFAKSASNWILGDLSRLMNLENGAVADLKVAPDHLAELINLVDNGSISGTMAKTVLEEAFSSGNSPVRIVKDKGYAQINDAGSVKTAVAEAIANNPKAVADYMGGKETATQFLVGQVMKITKGQAKPGLVNQLMLDMLEARREKS
ncbi:MAG: glutaminyl-tRNA synthase (glutamine-hydrolyzing) subunit B [SAR202 cluster bacterium Io17-Chloro-G7]|nr:MAG: glutaminyl-tRNA synthase (glutamine-hydrolyzing) subunit B [SAR202 cluster bacterium Io17-Chloro-G7]